MLKSDHVIADNYPDLVRYLSAYVQLEGNLYRLVAGVICCNLLHELYYAYVMVLCVYNYTCICITVPSSARSRQHLYYMIPMKFCLHVACV